MLLALDWLVLARQNIKLRLSSPAALRSPTIISFNWKPKARVAFVLFHVEANLSSSDLFAVCHNEAPTDLKTS